MRTDCDASDPLETVETCAPSSVAQHEAAVARALRLQGAFPENWVPERPGADNDVLVVGGGQSGVAIAFALLRAGISRTSVIDAAQEGAEGIWLATARMNALRSPKTLPGPELGIPELGFQAWCEARYGEAAYEGMQSIPRVQWAAYLRWFRKAVGVSVRFQTRLEAVEPVSEGLRVRLSVAGQPRVEVCRKLVLATGFAGSGGPHMPAFIKRSLPAGVYAHAEQPIEFDALSGRRIAIFGAGSAAFDAAAAALEAGAATVHMFCRHDDLECYSRLRMLYYPGSVEHFRLLPDSIRWRIMSTLCRRAQGPVPDTVRRAARFQNFHIHLGAREAALRQTVDSVCVQLGGRDTGLEFDFIIAGTGYAVDLAARPELANFVEHVALWGDRHTPDEAEGSLELARYPYLSSGFAFTEKEAGSAPYLKDIHFFGAAALISNGRNPGEVSGFRHGIPQLVSAIGGDLFTADAETHAARVLSPCRPILTGREYAARIWREPRAIDDEAQEAEALNAEHGRG